LKILAAAYAAVTLVRVIVFFGTNVSTMDEFTQRLYHPAHVRADALIAGMILAEVAALHSTRLHEFFRSTKGMLLVAFAVVLLVVGHRLSFESTAFVYSVLRFNMMNIGFGSLLLLALDGTSMWSRALSAPVWTPFARLSYGMYLWHPIVGIIGLGSVIGSKADHVTWAKAGQAFVVEFILIFLWCLLVFCLVEYPFLARKWRKPTASVAEGASPAVTSS
jgi:peptidoglycan/LPS O-acetylase OafA/YrhL